MILGVVLCIIAALFFLISLTGLRMQEPNEAMAMLFFGNYKGTFRKTGFYWVNFLYSSKRVSLRARNLNVDPIKVNDKTGNPILIGQILVWKLKDTYKAMFEIDSQTIAGGTNGWQQALKNYLEAISLNPESPAVEAHRMLIEILEFYDKDMYNQ